MIIALCVSVCAASDWVPIVKRVEPSIVRVESTGADGESVCSGVVVGVHIVVTAAHCIPNDPLDRSVAVNRKDAEVLRLNRTLDLAVLRVGTLTVAAMPFATQAIATGLPVAVCGFGLASYSLKCQFGFVSDVDDHEVQFGPWLDLVAVAGDSGGAVVDDSGLLITLIRARMEAGYALTVEPDVLREFVAAYAPPVTQ